jgi:hypothetical protein
MPIEVSPDHIPTFDWPNKFARPMAQINIQLEKLCELLGVNYFRERDDLDEYLGSVLNPTRLGPITFQYYLQAPIRGVVVYGDIKASPRAVVDMLIEDFGIPEELILWLSPDSPTSPLV